MKKILFVVIISLVSATTQSQTRGQLPTTVSGSYLTPEFKTGQRLGTIFSRTIAMSSEECSPLVFRISGTANYTVTNPDAASPVFSAIFLYDGRPADTSTIAFRDGGSTLVYNNKPAPNNDASGLAYNPLLWGIPPAKLTKGSSWEVDIAHPWELGGAGHQRIEVIDADPITHLIRLKREGDGEGFFADEPPVMDVVRDGKRVRVKVSPGKHHWVGYTTFKNGIVISDELMVVRPLTLETDSLKFAATQRQYILLNQMPL